ncbi:MAG: redoxin domain-containing protein [Acidimicrobiia bacterium]|nr:redoxin domain-containing protein [Acidimicrobiia bacterium]
MQQEIARRHSRVVKAAFALTIASILVGSRVHAQQVPQGLVPTVRAAIAKQDFKGGEQLIADYRQARGLTPEMVEAVSWLGRGALAAKQYDQATSYANQTYDLVRGLLKTRGLDDEPRLPIALGAAIEVIGQSRAATGARSEAVAYLRRELKTYGKTSMTKRIQKNINLLSLEGTKAPSLDLSESLAPKPLSLEAVKGKVTILFFWAHWCPDCKNQGPALANLLKKHEGQGLSVIAPTQLYGYVARGKEAGPEEERSYIADIKSAQYGFLDDRAVTLAEANHQRYGVSTTPTLVLLDRAGIVRSYHPGQMPEAELDSLVQRLVAERTAGTR